MLVKRILDCFLQSDILHSLCDGLMLAYRTNGTVTFYLIVGGALKTGLANVHIRLLRRTYLASLLATGTLLCVY